MLSSLVGRSLLALVLFIVLVIASSVAVGIYCFPFYSHVPTKPECLVALNFPAVAAVIAGAVFGWRCRFKLALLGALIPIVGLAILLSRSYLDYWYGSDVVGALWRAGLYCVVPALVASLATSALSRGQAQIVVAPK